jgi:hypothetical protein
VTLIFRREDLQQALALELERAVAVVVALEPEQVREQVREPERAMLPEKHG